MYSITQSINCEQLISEVQKRSPLWDKSHPQHNSRTVIDGLWDEISAVLEYNNRNNLRGKWKYLRDQYRREKVKERSKAHQNETNGEASSATEYRSPWQYYDMMGFMAPQINAILEPPDPAVASPLTTINNDAAVITNGVADDDDGMLEIRPELNNLEVSMTTGKTLNIHVTAGDDGEVVDITPSTLPNIITGNPIGMPPPTATLSSGYQPPNEENATGESKPKLKATKRKYVRKSKAPSTSYTTNTTAEANVDTKRRRCCSYSAALQGTATEEVRKTRRGPVPRNPSFAPIRRGRGPGRQKKDIKQEMREISPPVVKTTTGVGGDGDNIIGSRVGIGTSTPAEWEEIQDRYSAASQQRQLPVPLPESNDQAIYYFLASLVPHMKTLDPKKRLSLQIRIQDIVYNHVYETPE